MSCLKTPHARYHWTKPPALVTSTRKLRPPGGSLPQACASTSWTDLIPGDPPRAVKAVGEHAYHGNTFAKQSFDVIPS